MATATAAALTALVSRAIVVIRVPAAIVAMTGATTTIPARSVVAAIVAGVAATRPGSRGGRAAVAINRGSYGNSRGGKRGGSSRRPGDGGGKRK